MADKDVSDSKKTSTSKPRSSPAKPKKAATTKPAAAAAGGSEGAKAKRVVRERKVIRRAKGALLKAPVRKVNVYDLEGNVLRSVQLPVAFEEQLRPDLIRRAVKAAQANRRQPYGPGAKSGMMHAVSTWGKGRGVARVQRLSQGRRAAESPCNVGGRRAHPPKVEKQWTEKINRKERRKARNSALNATSINDLVRARGHRFRTALTLPVITIDEIEEIAKTKEILDIFQNMGIYPDIRRAERGKHIRAGRGRNRGRKYRVPKSVLLVVSDLKGLERAINNISGVDVVTPSGLNTEYLAPGGDYGRLSIWSESALQQVGEW